MAYKWILLILVLGYITKGQSQLKIGDAPTIKHKSVVLDLEGSEGKQGLWLPRVSDTSNAGINGLNPPNGLIIFHTPTNKLFVRSNNIWISYLQTAIASVTAGGTPMTGPALIYNTGTDGTDFNISSTGNTATWNLPNASATARGVVTTTAQTFGGNKVFNDSIRVNNGSTLNNGTTANGGLTITGATGVNSATSNLTLGINSSTTPIGTIDKVLSVNAQGQVTLNAVSITTNNALKIKTYTKVIDGAPLNLANNTPTKYTFTFTGQSLSTNSSVIVTPVFAFKLGTAIHYSRVVDANTIEMVMTYWASGGTQPINSGTDGTYNITIIEF